MTLGPFLLREFRISSRRRSLYFDRTWSAALVLAVFGCVHAVWSYFGWERSTVGGMARFTFQAFAAIVVLQGLGAGGAVASAVAPRIAGERERKTLDALLASRLSSAEIVLGTTAEGLAGYLSGLLTLFPIVLLMVPLGGIDPRLVFLSFGGLLSMAFFMAALSAAVSAGSRDRRAAVGWATGLSMAWMIGPMLTVVLLPKLWPGLSRWVAPAALVALDSSPVGVVANLAGAIRRGQPVEAILRMIGYQVAGGVLLLLTAIVRLRPASRAAHDGETRTAWLLQTDRSRRGRWPDCGDDPVFWRERHSRPAATRLGRFVGRLVGLSCVGFLVAATCWFAAPAFGEVFARGYGATGAGLESPELTPIALALARGWSGRPPAGQARVEFNAVLRQFTVFWGLLVALNLAGFATVGIVRERAQDTWSGLLATPLTGGQIVRAKMLAAAWRMRVAAAVLLVLWTVGLLAGAVHPLGYALAIAGLGVSSWFLVAVGTFFSLRATELGQANNRASTVVGVLLFSAVLPVILPAGWPATIMMGAASAPMHAGLALFSYEDVREALRSGEFPALRVLGLETGEGAWMVLATCLVGLAGQAIAAAFLTSQAIDEFDEAVGRPCRSAEGPAPGPASCRPPTRWR